MINIVQYKDFKKEFEFNLIKEIALLKLVQKLSWNSKTQKKSSEILYHILDGKRVKSDKEHTITYEYVIYLSNFMQDRPKTFDNLLEYVENNKTDYIGIDTLKELIKEF